MSGKRKPSPESSLTLISPNALLLSSPFCTYPFYGDDDRNSSKNNGGTSFLKLNQQKIRELTKSTKIVQRPQKQKAVLSTRSKTFDSIPPSLEVNNNPFPPSSSPFDYDSVHSPGGVSNASSEGPTYVRTPGFEHHAQEFEIQRKRQQCSKSHAPFASRVDEQLSCNDQDAACGQEHVRSSSKASQNGSVSNATSKKKKSVVFGTSDGKHETEAVKKTDPSQQTTSKHKPKKGVRSTSPPEDGLHPLREVSVANTDLLFSLFRGIEEEQPRVTVVRRGRPKKPPSTVLTRVLRDDDPCLVSAVTESILPLIPDRTGSGSHASRLAQGQQVLAMVSLKDGDKSLSLPSLNVEHNYSQILSELVIKL
ncbi:uncharacterized protein LOC110827008 isoform X2 [Zootermopsis nevadensis]|uniref:uncharacterized protein LOC110827008 isoform X2 n=1 Tax=Zootermopsis nevadensis TaxID=136037 RepID=UPI000B8EDCDB|nr:uncharacterized protein LOC110827008 isoform X2 [Zootermopsis nevadensis]